MFILLNSDVSHDSLYCYLVMSFNFEVPVTYIKIYITKKIQCIINHVFIEILRNL